jgi:hypothetical protein
MDFIRVYPRPSAANFLPTIKFGIGSNVENYLPKVAENVIVVDRVEYS